MRFLSLFARFIILKPQLNLEHGFCLIRLAYAPLKQIEPIKLIHFSCSMLFHWSFVATTNLSPSWPPPTTTCLSGTYASLEELP